MEVGLHNCTCRAGGGQGTASDGGQGTASDTSSHVSFSFPLKLELHDTFCIAGTSEKSRPLIAGARGEAEKLVALVVYGKLLISQCFCICLAFI